MRSTDHGPLVSSRGSGSLARDSLARGLVCAVVGIAVLGLASAASADMSLQKKAAKAMHLTGEVIKAKKGVPGHPGSTVSSTIVLRSGSKSAGRINFTACSGLAISFLSCGGKATVNGIGSGLAIEVEWQCQIHSNGKLTCASRGDGLLSSKTATRAKIRIKASQENILTVHRRFPVVVRAAG